MENKPRFYISEESRNAILSFRQRRKKQRLEEEEKKNSKKNDSIDFQDVMDRAVDIAMDELCPSYKKLQEHLEKSADSAWFAMSELERVKTHMDEVHGGKTDECEEGCFKDFSLEDGKEYMQTVLEDLKKTFKD